MKNELGRGGIGKVTLATDTSIGREVAIKELIAAGGWAHAADHLTERFLREARLTAQLEHPGVAPVHEIGRKPDGQFYYSMKVVRGRTLGEAIVASQGLRQRIELLPHFIDVCQTIAYAHSKGVIHRDLKPDNVMVGAFGETIVLDWGLAKKSHEALGEPAPDPLSPEIASTAPGLTAAGSPLGTPAYMSPEQANGDLEAIDERSDVWSLGVTLYELLTGRLPFEGNSLLELVMAIGTREITPVSEIERRAPAELIAICQRCLASRPEHRYADAGELALELERYVSGGLVSAYAYSRLRLVVRWLRAHRRALVRAAAACASLFFLVLWLCTWVVFRDTAGAISPEQREAMSISVERSRLDDLVKLPTAPGNAAVPIFDAIHNCVAGLGRSKRKHCMPYDWFDQIVTDLDGEILDRPERRFELRRWSRIPELDRLRQAARQSDYQTWGAVLFPTAGRQIFSLPILRFKNVGVLIVLGVARAQSLVEEGQLDEANRWLADMLIAAHHLERDISMASTWAPKYKALVAEQLADLVAHRGQLELATRWRTYAAAQRDRHRIFRDDFGREVSVTRLSDAQLRTILDDPDILVGLRLDAHLHLVIRACYGSLVRMMFGPFAQDREYLLERPADSPMLAFSQLLMVSETERGFLARAWVLIRMAAMEL